MAVKIGNAVSLRQVAQYFNNFISALFSVAESGANQFYQGEIIGLRQHKPEA